MQADPPSLFVLPAPAEETIAAADEPGWTLLRREGVLILRRPGLPEVRAAAPMVQDTPDGRITTATVEGHPDLRLVVRYRPGLCRTVRLGESSGIVTLILPDGTSLPGCAAPGWEG